LKNEGPVVTDNKLVERIITHIPSFMKEKTPLDCVLGILKTMKMALGKAYKSLTIFIIDKPL
jgi:hypothetical protein